MTLTSVPPITNATARFRDICESMRVELSKLTPNQSSWARLEQMALEILEHDIYIDKHILGPGLCLSGSGRIIRKLYDITPECSWTQYLSQEVHSFPSGTLRQLSNVDIAWLTDQGFAKDLLHPSLSVIIADDDLELLRIISQGCGISQANVLLRALAVIPFTLLPLPNLANDIVSALRGLVGQEDWRDTLTDLLESAVSKRDLRFTSALLSLGVDIPLEDGAAAWTKDPQLIGLLDRTASHHGRMHLVTMEPNPVSIFERPSPGPFHGLYETVLRQPD